VHDGEGGRAEERDAMTIGWQEQLKRVGAVQDVLREATDALVRMDAKRLEELALCCSDLNREVLKSGPGADVAARFQDALPDMEVLRLVLAETRIGLSILYRFQAVRFARPESVASTSYRMSGEPGLLLGRGAYGDD
jgi:hypothetical protein